MELKLCKPPQTKRKLPEAEAWHVAPHYGAMKTTNLSRSSPLHSLRAGFSLIELLVVIGIIAILAALLLPALAKARDTAKRGACMGNLRQVYLGIQLYAEDHDGLLPTKFEVKKNVLTADDIAKGKQLNTPALGIQTVMARYTGTNTFRCPADRGDSVDPTPVFTRKGDSYEVKGWDPEKAVKEPQKVRLEYAAKLDLGGDPFKPWEADDPAKVAEKISKNELGPIHWHQQRYNFLLGDGHVVAIASKEQEKAEKGDD